MYTHWARHPTPISSGVRKIRTATRDIQPPIRQVPAVRPTHHERNPNLRRVDAGMF